MHHGDLDGRITFASVGDDALLLHEFSHRTANEIAAASAAVHLARRTAAGTGLRLLDQAVDRLAAFGELHRVLARPVRARVNVATDLVTVCRAIASSASRAERSVVSVDVPDTWVDGDTARRIVLVAAELVTNSVRHALEARPGRLDVSLEIEEEQVVLTVRDDGPGLRPGRATSGTGLGTGIVAQLVGRAGGTVATESGRAGTAVRVALPLGARTHGDSDVAF